MHEVPRDNQLFSETSSKKHVDDVEHNEMVDGAVDLRLRADAEKRLVRKIDLYLMPCIWIVYLFSYMVQCLPFQKPSHGHQS